MQDDEAWLHVSLFGALSVSLESHQREREEIPLSGRSRTLLAFLAVSRHTPRRRSELSDTLWSENGDAARAGTFNTALWRLRQAIERPPLGAGEIIVCDRNGHIGLCSGTRLRTDIDAYASLVAPVLAKPFERLVEDDISNLRLGVSMYRGEVLEGFVDDWALRERERQRRQQLSALARLVQWSQLQGDPMSAIRHAQAILDLDALREDVHRELMRLYLQVGQRAMALRQFERCREALRHELAISPMRETLAVYQEIADGALVGNARPRPPEAPLPRSAPAALSTRALIASARSQIAAADAQLQLALPLLPSDETAP